MYDSQMLVVGYIFMYIYMEINMHLYDTDTNMPTVTPQKSGKIFKL
jgi:hypothetical protein